MTNRSGETFTEVQNGFFFLAWQGYFLDYNKCYKYSERQNHYVRRTYRKDFELYKVAGKDRIKTLV